MTNIHIPIKELRTDYVDFYQNLRYLDAYLTDDENENGFTVGVICEDTKKVILWPSTMEYHTDPLVLQAIQGFTYLKNHDKR